MTRKVGTAEKRRRAAETLLDPAVIRELAAAVPGFDRAGLLASLIDCWGGQDELATSIVLEFQRAAPGSMVRQRILDMILRLISQHSNDEAIVAVEDMDDATLRAQILAIVPALEALAVGVEAKAKETADGRDDSAA